VEFRVAVLRRRLDPAEVTLGAPRLDVDGMFTVDFGSNQTGSGRWRVRADTLERVAELPPLPSELPAALQRVESTYPGMEVQSLTSRYEGRRYVLRWETLPRNRDRPRDEAPPPSALRIYELPDREVAGARAHRLLKTHGLRAEVKKEAPRALEVGSLANFRRVITIGAS